MILAAHQPNYLPWLGFFDKIRQSDVLIIQDNVQFEYHDFQNRTRIKTAQGVRWLTVPIKHTGNVPINEVLIANETQKNWARNHWLNIKYNYCRAPYWEKYSSFFEQTYRQKWIKLIDLNMHLIKGLMEFLSVKTPLIMASSLGVSGHKSELVLAQSKALGANVYFSGIGARSYLDVQRFTEEGIKVIFQNFEHPVYAQLYGGFVHGLSAIDYLFCVGGKSWKTAADVV